MKSLLAGIFLVSILFSACTTASTPVATSLPPTATAAADATSTLPPAAVLNQAASLYAGPGNADFDSLAALNAGVTVVPLATYGDFVQVTASLDGQERTGYVWKDALQTVPSGLAELAGDQVPWQPLYLAQCSPGLYDAAQDSVTYTNPGDGYADTESSAIPLNEPLKIAVKNMRVDGDSGAGLKILGIPEPSSGDWWKGITRMDVGDYHGQYYLSIRDGRAEGSSASIDLSLSVQQGLQILFTNPHGTSFHVLDGSGREVQFVDLTMRSDLDLPDGLFPSGMMYLGTTLPPHESLTVTGLHVGVQASGKWDASQDGYYTQPGLAVLAGPHHLTIGTEFSLGMTADPRYCKIMQRDFNLAVLSEFSSEGVWLGPGKYDFSTIDAAVDYASRQGWRIRASHLLWGEPSTLPDWLKNSHYTRAEYIQLMEQYIRDVVGRYRGRVQEWSIANEATGRSFWQGTDFWNDKIGPEYIALAFQTAREADPNGVLIFNDDNNQAPQDASSARVVDKMYATVKQLKAQGVPIDVVGMQMHLLLPWNSQVLPDKAKVIATMQKFAALGVRIYVTEFDVDMQRQPGTPDQKRQSEAGLYRDMLEACLESGVCDSFSTWEFSDAVSWVICDSEWCVKDKDADPLPFDARYLPKPAYFAVREALLTDFTLLPTPTPVK